MKFNHLFYDSHVNFNSISKKRIVLSIFLGLVSAVLIYSFFYVLRETDRMMFLDFEYRPIVIPETERQLYNLFFAAISMILGNSITISFLFSRPQNAFSRRNNKRTRILNDQAFLGFNFIYWFAKVWFLFGIFVSQFMGTKFITTFILPSILLIIVFYLDLWKTLITVINKNRWKIQCVHLIVFLILTFILSRVDVIDYKTIEESAYKIHPTIQVPNSSYNNDNYQRRYYDELVFKMYFNTKNEVGLFNSENEPIEYYAVYTQLKDWEGQLSEELQYRFSPRLRADENVPIKNIKEFELELMQSGHWKIIYEIYNDDELTSKYYNNQLRHFISPSLEHELPVLEGKPPRIPIWKFKKELNVQDTLRIKISDKIVINNLEVPLNMLPRKLKTHINQTSIIEYIYSEDATYQDYINVLSAHKTAVWELRATENYDKIDEMIRRNQFSRDEKLYEERNRILEMYPFRITERFE